MLCELLVPQIPSVLEMIRGRHVCSLACVTGDRHKGTAVVLFVESKVKVKGKKGIKER